MSLNPLAFDSVELFEKALMEEGLKRGWVPMVDHILPRQSERGVSVSDSTTDGGRMETPSFLHYGAKGMRWGVRKNTSSGSSSVTVTQKGKKRLKARGGEGHPASSDAIDAQKLGRQAKKSGFQSLSNQQLQQYSTRVNLQQNAKRANFESKNAGQKFVSRLLGQTGRTAANQAAKQAISKDVGMFLLKKAAVPAVATALTVAAVRMRR